MKQLGNMLYEKKSFEIFFLIFEGSSNNNVKVRDHCHGLSKFRRAAHSSCNLKLEKKQSTVDQLVPQNLNKYDSHSFLKEFK